MHHPRNKAERRRIDAKKKHIDKHEREDYVRRRLEQEALEQKAAFEELSNS